MSGKSLRDLAPYVAKELGASTDDILRHIGRGDIILDSRPGFIQTLDAGTDGVVYANSQVRYRYLEYKKDQDLIRRQRQSGINNFYHIMEVIRRSESPTFKADMYQAMKPKLVYGNETVYRPFMGHLVRMPIDMNLPFHQFLLQRFLLRHMNEQLDAVFEIGSGIGDCIAELAARNPFQKIEFFGGEIALNGHRCLSEFADMLGLRNLHGVEFDVLDPDFGFLKNKRNVLIYSHFSLVYAKPFPCAFFEKLLDAAENVTVLLFEPFSFALADEMKIVPFFDRDRAQNYNIAENFWECITHLKNEERIEIDELIPDVAGKTVWTAVSLVRFRKRHR